jgi:hypothetical protein
MRWHDVMPADTPFLPLTLGVYVHKLLSMKCFHRVSTRNAHKYSLKSKVGKVSS